MLTLGLLPDDSDLNIAPYPSQDDRYASLRDRLDPLGRPPSGRS